MQAFPLSGNRAIRRSWVLAAVLWLVLCLLWTAPASLFAALMQKALPALRLEAVTGSFWQGRAGQAYWIWQGRLFSLGALQWRVKPWSLLWLRPGVHLSATYGEQFLDTEASIGVGGVQLRDTRAALPISALSFWLPVPADGLLALRLNRARFDAGQPSELTGELDLQRMRWQWNERWLTLGDYRVQLKVDDNGLTGDVSGGTTLAASGQVKADLETRKYRLSGTLKTSSDLPSELRDGIRLMLAAKPLGDGVWQLERSGNW